MAAASSSESTATRPLPIVLKSPDALCTGERNSKLLCPESQLAKTLEKVRAAIRDHFPPHAVDFRPLHTDLSIECPDRRRDAKAALVAARAKLLHGQTVDAAPASGNWGFMGVGERAFVLWLPTLEGGSERECRPHVTVAYLRLPGKDCLPNNVQQDLLALMKKALQPRLAARLDTDDEDHADSQ
jgi:hypothetical protein